MSDRAALLAAIKAFPEADTPRLVFADWLDEHGESERAEFIRDGVAAARKEGPPCTVGNARPHPDLNEGPWTPLREANRWRLFWCQYDRGFLFDIECTAADWLAHADAILAEHPVRRVRLTDHTVGNPPCVLGTGGALTRTALSAKWPGIEFELQQPAAVPPFNPAQWLEDTIPAVQTWLYNDLANTFTAEFLHGLGVPPHIIDGTAAGGGE